MRITNQYINSAYVKEKLAFQKLQNSQIEGDSERVNENGLIKDKYACEKHIKENIQFKIGIDDQRE